MKVQEMPPAVADDALIVPPLVTVIVSPDPQEIDMQLLSDPLAVDPLLIRAEDIKKEVKIERILDTCGTQMKDEKIDETYSMTVVEPMAVLVPSAVSLEEELTPQCLQEEDPLENIPNVPPLKPVFHKIESQETLQDEKIDETSSMIVLEPMTVLVPSAVFLEEELTPQCSEEEDPLEIIPNVPPLKPAPHKIESQETLKDEKIDETSSMTVVEPVTVLVPSAFSLEGELTPEYLQEEDPLENSPNLPLLIPVLEKMESQVTSQVLRDETTSTLQSSSDLSPMRRNEEHYEPSTLVESVNEPSENQQLMEGLNVGRVTRKSAAIARTKIRRTRGSKDDSSSSESNSEDSDQDYQSSDDKNSDDVDLGNEDEQERDWTKDVPDEIAPWCSCGMHPPSVLDGMIKQLHLNIRNQPNGMSESSQFQQVSRDKTPNDKLSRGSSSRLRNEEHVETRAEGESVNEPSEKCGLYMEPDHVIRKSIAANYQLDVNGSFDNVDSRKKNLDQQKRDSAKGIPPEIAPRRSCEMYSPNALDKLVHDGHQQTAFFIQTLKDQFIYRVTLNNEDNSINCQNKLIASKGLVTASGVNTTHERQIKKNLDIVHVRPKVDIVSLESKNTSPLIEKVSNNCDSSPVFNDDHLNLVMHVKSNINILNRESKNTLPLTEKGSDICDLFPVVNDDNLNLIMEVESNTNIASVGSKNTVPLTEKVLDNCDSPPVVNGDKLKIMEVESNTNILSCVSKSVLPLTEKVSEYCKSSLVVKGYNEILTDVESNSKNISLGSKSTVPLAETVLVKSRNLTETSSLIQIGNVIQKKVLENNESSSIVNCTINRDLSMVCLENGEKVIPGENCNSDQYLSISFKSPPEKHNTMSHLIDTHQSKLQKLEKFIENCENESTKHLQKLKKLKKDNYGEANQYDENQRKQNLKNCVDRCPKDGRKLMNCPVCGIKIKTHQLKTHSLKHSDNRPIKCKLCPKAFKTIYDLQSHTRHIHENTFMKCKLCEKQYKSKQHFRRHMELHKGIEPPKAKCNICGKVFEKRKISRHIATHSTDYKFSCNICNKKFKEKQGLKYHISNVHDSKPGPRHICEICGVIMKSPSALSDHMNIHTKSTPYTCDVCGKSFLSKSSLVSHLTIHGEKKFKCDICGYASSRLDNLITHIRSHTGEKPFKCCICSQTFTRQDNLQTHKRGVHKVE